MTFEADYSKPPGSRIVSATLGCEPMDMQREYVISTRGYMARGKGMVWSRLGEDVGSPGCRRLHVAAHRGRRRHR